MRGPRGVLALFGAAELAASLLAQEPPDRRGGVRAEARVDRVVVDAYVLDPRGDPIANLSVNDFRVRVDGRQVALESAEWIPADLPEAAPLAAPPRPEEARRVEFAPGRLLILFFQTDMFETSRLVGSMRMALQAKKFLDALLPTDRVAVLSFDSHLKLRQDFTSDRQKIEAAIDSAIRAGPPPAQVPSPSPSLARNFDFQSARRAVTPERALAIISTAAAPIAGGKSMLFFGWGLGTIGGVTGPNPRDQRDYEAALPALAAARINVFTLDVTDADYHTLEGRLQQLSDITGGTYQKTHLFPGLAMDRVRRALSGRYVLVFVKPEGERGYHEIAVELAKRKGSVMARTYYRD